MAQPIRIHLNEEGFRSLVRGDVADVDGVRIRLKDIGYERMVEIIDRAAEERYFKEHEDT